MVRGADVIQGIARVMRFIPLSFCGDDAEELLAGPSGNSVAEGVIRRAIDAEQNKMADYASANPSFLSDGSSLVIRRVATTALND